MKFTCPDHCFYTSHTASRYGGADGGMAVLHKRALPEAPSNTPGPSSGSNQLKAAAFREIYWR